MGEKSTGNWKAAEEAELYLRGIPKDLLGPAGRVLVLNPPVLTKRDTAATLRGIKGRRSEPRAISQPPLMTDVGSD